MKYTPEITEYFLPMTVLMRLNPDDTKFLLERMREAASRGTGVNLVLMKLKGAISQVRSQEHQSEVKFIAEGQHGTFRVESPQLGYNGKYSHVELTTNKVSGLEVIRIFLKKEAKWQRENQNPQGQQ